jgi:diguanylate cyclase (GGDEF)-like protein
MDQEATSVRARNRAVRRAPSTIRAGGRRQRWWVAASLIAVYLALVEVAAHLAPDTAGQKAIGIPAAVVSAGSAGVCGWFAVRTRGAERRWRLSMAASMAVLGAAVVSGLWIEPSGYPHRHAAGPSDVLTVVAGAFALAALLTFPGGGGRRRTPPRTDVPRTDVPGADVRGQTRGPYRTLVVDGLLVTGSLFLLVWASVLRPVFAAVHAAGQNPWTLDVAALLTDLTLMAAAVMVAAFRGPRDRIALALVGTGLAALASTASAVAYLAATSGTGAGPTLYVGALLGPALVGCAAATRAQAAARTADSRRGTHRGGRGQRRVATRTRPRVGVRTLLPYALLAATGTVMTLRHAFTGERLDQVDEVVGLTLLGLVVIRQLFVVRDNANLVLRVREGQQQLRYQAFHDPLTGLANRPLFNDRLWAAARTHAEAGRAFALLFLDLDGFKAVNDEVGHDAGDDVLRTVAARLRSATRRPDTVARFGGDEFAILLDDNDDPRAVGDRILATLGAPLLIGERTYTVGASVGLVVARATDTPVEPEDLLRQADQAMYAAKASGKGVVIELYPDQEPPAGGPALHRDLAAALAGDPAAGTIDVSYQPIVELPSGRLSALEALARWTHPTRGQVDPAMFVPAAEQGRLVEALDAAVLDRACQDLARWRANDPDGPLVHVNVSGTLAASDDLVRTVEDTLDRHGVPPHALVLEITETGQIPDLSAAAAVLSRLDARGVRCALDDVGTGHTSLEALRVLPLSLLKLDRALVCPSGDPRTTALRDGVLTIADSLGIAVVAEGIENTRHLRSVNATHVAYGQGYLFGRPTTATSAGPPRPPAPPAPPPPAPRETVTGHSR